MSEMTTVASKIPLLDLSPETDALWDELMHAIAGVVRSGHFVMGPNVKAFEEEVAAYLGVTHAVGVNSGTDALIIALRALGIGPGEEVITSPFTFFATAEAISHVGATPVFVDIEPDTLNLDVSLVEQEITSRTRAILPVHLFGQAADMDALVALAEGNGLKIVEDVAQAFGAEHRGTKVGTLGQLGAWSFFPSKNLGAFGDGGLITTDDDALAAAARMLRTHGSRKKYYNEQIGYNSRLDELQAAVLRVKLPHIDDANEGRRRVAAYYDELLREVSGVSVTVQRPFARHVYHQYTVRIHGGKRDMVQQRLSDAGIGTMIYYPVPVHKLPVYAGRECTLPVSEVAATEVLSLPIWPQMESSTIEWVVECIARALR
jgi:dTDP-4-amino-4,6-dideoxygalactose transaminase